ncbi:MAG: hypothetical protein U0271_04075 [Polyangiaceae bacterium]
MEHGGERLAHSDERHELVALSPQLSQVADVFEAQNEAHSLFAIDISGQGESNGALTPVAKPDCDFTFARYWVIGRKLQICKWRDHLCKLMPQEVDLGGLEDSLGLRVDARDGSVRKPADQADIESVQDRPVFGTSLIRVAAVGWA